MRILDRLEEILIATLMGAATLLIFVAVVSVIVLLFFYLRKVPIQHQEAFLLRETP